MNLTTKPLLHSATLWLNLIAVGLAALGAVIDAAQVLKLSPQEVAYFTIGVAVLNAAVRVIRTNKPLEGTPAAASLRHEALADHADASPSPAA